ncbi:uncharacterized protein LOC141602228 [Silene latifolia]|uniref:uncharacterized protein LOC141602228 n=1 Tax=Silene latifolia TaxID=37657 RepID=UPI003D770F67
MVKDGEEGPKTWEDGHNELKLEMAQMAYVLKNIASMLKAKEKKKESDTPSESEEEDEQPKRKSKNKNDDDRGLKLDIPDFDGEMDPEKFLDWVRQAERVFEYKEYDDKKQFKVAILKLTKYASLWYENLKKQRRKEGKDKIESWIKLKKHLMRRFLPRDYEQDNYLKLQSLEQGSMTVIEYIKEFEKMSIVCDLEEKEELRVARFIKGLTPAIAKRVEIQNYEGFNDVCRLAWKFEKHDKAQKPHAYSKGQSSGTNSYSRPAPSKAKEIPKEEPKDKGKGVAEPKGSSLRRCFKCQGYGHIANECPQKRALTAQELCDLIPVFVTPRKKQSRNVETDGEGLVYDLDPLSDEECLVFAGSCANVVARDLVDELKLQTKDRVKPYKLHWLNGENGIQVKKQALVSLSLGPYTDEVWCDIIPMNACHILLGRPWQFDRKVEHDGRANVYSVMKGNVRYNLKPMSPNKIKESKTKKGSMFMEAREVEEALARGKRTYVLLVRELGSVGVCDDRGVQELLEEFRDVFPDELPDGLPPLRGIEHQIDLIPGAALPNKPAYRCNPEEAKELQRQVQELIDRGYVQESLSPCAVPALLVPKKEGTWRIKDEESHKRHLRAVFEVLRDQKLYGKLEKCTFMVSSVVFLGYIVGKDGGFSSIVAPITELTKKGEFVWTNSAQKAFEESSVMQVVLGLVPCYYKKRDLLHISNEKLNGARLNYSTYDKEFYAIVRALDHWSHYLRPKPFILHSDHEALKHIHGQQKLNQRHAKWVEFLQSFTFSSKYKTGSSNVVADALSRRHSLLIELDARILGFEHIKEPYKSIQNFQKKSLIQQVCILFRMAIFSKVIGYAFRMGRLGSCWYEKLMAGLFFGHFGVNKTSDILSEHFYWPRMNKDVQEIVAKCVVCQKAKSTFTKGLYTPLPLHCTAME